MSGVIIVSITLIVLGFCSVSLKAAQYIPTDKDSQRNEEGKPDVGVMPASHAPSQTRGPAHKAKKKPAEHGAGNNGKQQSDRDEHFCAVPL
jgi:hypothetical protein